jgi:TRAP-type C4-dicarboxylate transport system permease small subunit
MVSIIDRVISFMAYLAGLLLFFLMLIICYEVVMRYLFRSPTGWVIEVCEFSLLYITFLGAAWLLKQDGHIRVDILFTFLNRKVSRILNTATSLLGAISCGFLFVYGLMSTWHHFRESTLVIQTLNTPKWVLLIVIPIGSFFLVLQFLFNVYGQYSGVALQEKGSSGESEE